MTCYRLGDDIAAPRLKDRLALNFSCTWHSRSNNFARPPARATGTAERPARRLGHPGGACKPDARKPAVKGLSVFCLTGTAFADRGNLHSGGVPTAAIQCKMATSGPDADFPSSTNVCVHAQCNPSLPAADADPAGRPLPARVEVKCSLRWTSCLGNACPGLSWHEGEMLSPLVWGGVERNE